ncbi:MAG: acetyltransferase [Xanthobacteraceae bacterium]|nr:MAG: acetyltransferase [Xanthobacteraceae bacterium]
MSAAIDVVDNPETQEFQARIDGHLALAEYRLIKGAIMFAHTEVPEGGARRARHRFGPDQGGVAAARERELKVMPVCPFFAAWFGKHPESYRTALGL